MCNAGYDDVISLSRVIFLGRISLSRVIFLGRSVYFCNLRAELSFVALTIHLCNGLNDKNLGKTKKLHFVQLKVDINEKKLKVKTEIGFNVL